MTEVSGALTLALLSHFPGSYAVRLALSCRIGNYMWGVYPTGDLQGAWHRGFQLTRYRGAARVAAAIVL